MKDVRRIIVIFVIAVLFTIFVNVTIEAFYERPEYSNYCEDKFAQPRGVAVEPQKCTIIEPSQEVIDSCPSDVGRIAYHYDSSGCPKDSYCETCDKDLDSARAKYNLVVFIVSAISGLVALVVGLHLPKKKNPLHEWVGSGFLLGGLITIFVGTLRYFGDMGRYARPLVILLELILVIYLTYKKLGKK